MSELQKLIELYCPDGVEYKALRELVERTSNIKWAEHPGVEYSYIDLTSVDRQTHRITEASIIDAENAPSRARQIVHIDDVLFGGTRPTLMRYCLVPIEYDGQIASTGYIVLRVNRDAICPGFLMHCLGRDDFIGHLETYQKGSAYPAISRNDMLKYRIPVPPIEVQREIVRLLDAYTAAHDALIDRLNEEIELQAKSLAAYRESLLTFSERERERESKVGHVG